MENMEQPNQQDLGSKENFGKFKDAESLLKAYANLESEFTKKSQRLASLEQLELKRSEQESQTKENERKVEEFITKFEKAKPFSSALKESLNNNQNLNLGEEAFKMIANNYKSAEDYANDSEFLNNYIFSNKEIKDKIVKDYLSQITQNSPIKMQSSANITLTPPRVPTTIQEAGKMAKTIIKHK